MNIIKIITSGCEQDNANKDDILCLLQQFNKITIFLMWFNVSVLSVCGLSRFAATRMRSIGNVLGNGAVMTKLSFINDVK